MSDIDQTVATIHAKILLDKGHPDYLVAAYVADRFPDLSPDDLEHAMTSATKTEWWIRKREES